MPVLPLLHRHHALCDELFAGAEAAVRLGEWAEADRLLERFITETDRHFEAEEGLLFPAFEQAVGHGGGPTQVMRIEHRQMRPLFGQMRTCCLARDVEGFTGAADTLLVLMQQHNMKEEHILYPMCDQALAGNDMTDALRGLLSDTCVA